jgi:hypothetical protein
MMYAGTVPIVSPLSIRAADPPNLRSRGLRMGQNALSPGEIPTSGTRRASLETPNDLNRVSISVNVLPLCLHRTFTLRYNPHRCDPRSQGVPVCHRGSVQQASIHHGSPTTDKTLFVIPHER